VLQKASGIPSTFAGLVDVMGGGENGTHRAASKENYRSERRGAVQSGDVLSRYGELTKIMGGECGASQESCRSEDSFVLSCALVLSYLYTPGRAVLGERSANGRGAGARCGPALPPPGVRNCLPGQCIAGGVVPPLPGSR
jgi:hypothetical protein